MSNRSAAALSRWPTPEWALGEAKVYLLAALASGGGFLALAFAWAFPLRALVIVAAFAGGWAARVRMRKLLGARGRPPRADALREEKERKILRGLEASLMSEIAALKSENDALKSEIAEFRRRQAG